MGEACKHALKEAESSGHSEIRSQIRGFCVDSTACSVLLLDRDKKPLRPCLLWCDR